MTIKDEIKFLEKKKNLIEKINLDKLNISKYELDFLKSLLNLEVSVLNDDYKNLIERLKCKDYFISLALYNICKRNIKLISSLDIDTTKLEYFFDENTFFIRINGDSRKLFYIELNKLHSSHQIDSKKYQGYFYSKIESEEQLTCNLEQRINLINSGKIKNSDGSIKSYREREFELLNLRKELVYIKENGKEIIDIFNKTNETLRRDYGVRKDEIPLYGRVRSLSFVDIYEKRLWRFYDR